MLLSIDFGSDQPIYTQIRNGIVTGIASGTLKDGDSLPSVRTLGAEIGVNLHTVNKAYQLLQSEGFIEIQRRRGTFIKAGNAAKNAAEFLKNCGDPLKTIVSEAVTRRVDRAVLHQMIDHMYDELEGNES
ncbi:GntR family transcriptional regulator [Sporolactobacillus nakayamae]|uniref:DNA-binding transcriptional regulator YhcF, GntR family n=1 Tax=Sporolactobacillus nakayamae TaxID=269670 RepID=A0A1I2SC35_9BACL|nr:GntR family transcriptional regulator [Sporolactobacillus nakayamae]SFG47586.1 DNA-binding transcriptional regulator YhcF, GntR family [Sporolactobacillus nakayamae]